MTSQPTDGLPDWVLSLLACPQCGAAALRRAGSSLTGAGLRCEGCGHRVTVADCIADLTLDDPAVPPVDRAYEGKMGESYARYMDSPALQRLDAWLLGMSVPRYYEETLGQLARLPDGPSLDMPAGGGPFVGLAPVYRDGGPWIFADLSWTMLRRLRKKCLAHGITDAAFIRADACRLPLADGVLRNVVSLFGLHCFHNKPAVFAELQRCLQADGRIVASTLTTDGPALSRLYMRLHRSDGTFARDNSLPELRTHAQGQSLSLEVARRLGAVLLFEARHA